MKSHYEKMSVTPLENMPKEGFMASSALIQKGQVTVDDWDPVLFDDGEGITRDYIDLTFE